MRLLLLISFLASTVAADRLSWDPPKERINGDPLAPEEISHYNLYCGGQITEIPGLTPEGDYPLSLDTMLPDYGSYDCTLTAVDNDGLESDHSNVLVLAMPAPPMAPTQFILIVE